ncbi:MAG: M56 family metallopeptidase [Pirellulales bacterium]
MLAWLIDKTVVVALLALLITLACRLGRFRPAVEHALWLILLLKLLCPPLVWWPWSAADLFPVLRGGELSAQVQPPRLPIRTEPIRVDPATGSRPAPVISFPAPSGDKAPAANAPSSQTTSLHPSAEGLPPSPPPGRFELMRRLDRGRLIVLFGWLWGIGAAAIFVHRLRQIARCRAVAKSARPGPAWLVDQAAQVAATLKLRTPRVLVAAGVRTPFVWCLGRPALVWPDDLADEADPARWRPVVAHELAHLKRRDHWVAWLQFAGECLWWWNPLFWFVWRRLRETAELACDAWAVSMAPDSRRMFAEALLVISRRTPSGRLSLPALGMDSGGRRNFERRLTMIFSDHTACRLSRRALFAAWLLAMLAVPCWSLGQDKPAEEKPAEEQSAEDPPAKVNVTAKAGPQRTIRVHDNRVYIADGKERTITALDGSSGKIVWQTKTDGWKGEVGLVFEGDELHLAGPDGIVVYKLDRETGKYLATEAAPEKLKDPQDDFTPPPKTEQADEKKIEADISVAEAEEKLRTAQNTLQFSERLLKKGYITQGQRDAHAFAVKRAELELAKAKSPLSAKQAGEAPDKSGIAVQASSSGLSGLVDLATAYIDAVGEHELAEKTLKVTHQLASVQKASHKEVLEAEQRLVTAKRKVKLFRKIAEAAKSAAEVDVHELKTMYESGRISRSQLSEAEIRLTVLMAILDS